MHSSVVPGHAKPVLYHLHIPKTAGTTLYALLEARFSPEKVCPVYVSSQDIMRMPRERFAAFDLVGGHWEFGYHLPAIMGRPVRPVTMLREPRAVVLSLYKQVMQEPLDPVRKYVDANCPTLEAFLFDKLMSNYVSDTQTRFLAIAERKFRPETIDRIRAAAPDQVQPIVRETNMSVLPASAYEMLHRGRSRLAECEVVGLVERFNESFAQICFVLGWPSSVPTGHKNVSRIKLDEQLPSHLLKRLDELTSLDQILYQEALERFERETAASRTLRRAA